MGILAGLRVVEVSAFVAAPSAGLALAQMGAEVIRIDDIRGGLDYRRWPVTEDNTSLFWQGLNKNKRSVAIDIRKPEGRELARSIICASGEDAGILLTNFPPRGWLDYESLREAREDLIQLTVMGNRHGGSAVDYTVNPAIGVPMFTGPEEHKGLVNSVIPAWDCITGQMAVSGLLAAERHRRRTGEGQHIKLALEDVAMATMGTLGFIAEAELGVDRERSGNYLYGAFGRDFISADGFQFMVVGLTPKQWRGLCSATGLGVEMEHLAQLRRLDFSREGDRYEARREIAALIESWAATRNIGEIEAAFAAENVCWNRYQSVKEMVLNDPACSEENPLFVRREQAGIGEMLMPGSPLEFTGLDRESSAGAPGLGEHTDQILAELLNMSPGEIGRLHDQKLVGSG
ncbi:CoA transferase [Pseudohalioglobus sediminis]|nr:CoA transferase [Pseudohalioglobus sediminis]